MRFEEFGFMNLRALVRCLLVILLSLAFQLDVSADQGVDPDSLLRALKDKVEGEVQAGGFSLTDEARGRVVSFLEHGLDELTSAGDSREAQKRIDRAMKSCEKFAKELKKASRKRSRGSRSVSLEDVQSTIRWLCPLYPFC